MGVNSICRLAVGVLVLSAACVNFAKADDEASDVFVLTSANFDTFFEENPIALVEFYAPWCGHCKNLAPHYEEAATRLKKAGSIPLAKVDAVAEPDLAQKYDVRGYPTLKLFSHGKPLDYTGGRTADLIVEWVESSTGPAVEIIDESAVATPEKGVMFVARVKAEDSAAFKLYSEVAESLRMSAKFVAVVDAAAKDELTVYRPDEDSTSTKITSDSDKLRDWIEEEKFPFFGPIDGENYSAYETRKQEVVWFAGTEDDFKTHSKEFREAAKSFREDYSFVWLDTGRFSSHAESGLGLTTLPGVVLRLREGGRFVFPEGKKYVAKELTAFFNDVKTGKVEKSLKSEPIPETNDEAVKVVVGKNFEDLVFQDDKDVMLEVYAPWCGHCKRLEPIYTEFAEKLAPYKHVVIAKMDGTANEPPTADFNFRGFPTIFWIKAGEKKPEQYNDARTLEGLLKFVKENASKNVDIEIEASEEGDKDEL
uniref:Protein disulfide-isomerase n=2 Tax=Lankesteria abbotti TaxID=340204 RepID=A0A7S2QRL0_9APIC|mmetsp:Transcript_680/g.776  ORF Transcript_680/g.776 Transcript_680/m.776 type:complete len:480 (+) Transcript_680:37-1476(+)